MTRPPRALETVAAGRVADLTQAMAARDRALESLSTAAVMEYSAGEEHVKAREEIVVRRPSSLRVEAMSPFGVALVLAAQGPHLQIFEPSDNTFLRGTANARTLARFARIPMEPGDAVALLMAVVPGVGSDATPDSVKSEGDLTVLAYREPDGSVREAGFTGGRLAVVRRRTASGAISYEVRYADYHDIGGVIFPYQVNADFPLTQSRVSFRYLRPIINVAVPDTTFVLTPGPNAKQMDISTAYTPRIGRDG